jgi:hypothetical protein
MQNAHVLLLPEQDSAAGSGALKKQLPKQWSNAAANFAQSTQTSEKCKY